MNKLSFSFVGFVCLSSLVVACSGVASNEEPQSGLSATTESESNEAASGAERGGAPAPAGNNESGVVTPPPAKPVAPPPPAVLRFVEVKANGTGCPTGTWSAYLGTDGRSFYLSLSEYEAVVEPGKAFSIKDCTITADIEVPAGEQYSVSELDFRASEALDAEGMTVRQSVKHYFQGDPVTAVDHSREIVTTSADSPPRSYTLRDTIGVDEAVWSPCGGGRTLNVQTRLTVKNNAEKTGHGTVRLSSGWMHRAFALRSRQCT
jgi:hypothetical protein